jgi:hypothetical protein
MHGVVSLRDRFMLPRSPPPYFSLTVLYSDSTAGFSPNNKPKPLLYFGSGGPPQSLVLRTWSQEVVEPLGGGA